MKKISAMMSMVLALTVLPLSANANSYPQLNLANGIAQEVTLLDQSKEVRFRVDLGKDLDLNEGRVIFEINNAKLAKGTDVVSAKVYQGSTVVNDSDVVISSHTSSSLDGATLFNLDLKSSLKADHINEISVIFSLKLDFTDSNLGDVSISIKDIGKNGVPTGIGNYEKTTANTKRNAAIKDFDIKVLKSDAKIGPAGGDLSNILIYSLDKLSDKANENEIIISLAKGYSFKPASTKVALDSGVADVTYNRDYSVMTITNISKSNAYINIEPSITVKADNNAKTEPVFVNIDFVNSKRSVSSKDLKIGELVSYGMTLFATEKGQRNIPTLTKGQAKTVELTIDAVEGTFVNGTALNFELENAKIVYGSIKVDGQSASLTAPRSAGRSDANKVSGYEVYQNETFALRLNKSGITQIRLTFDVVSDMNKKDATIRVSSRNLDDAKTVVAKNKQSLLIQTSPISVEKGVIANLPTITIKENEINTLQRGDKIYLEMVYPGNQRDRGQNIAFNSTKDIKVETENKLEIESVDFGRNENIIVLTVGSRSYSKAGVIKLTNIKGYLTEKAPEEQVNINVKFNDNIEDEIPYFTIGKQVALRTVFTINNKNYFVSGAEKVLVTAPYIKNGRTMLPVRAVADSLGLVASWDNTTKTATFKNDTKVAIVKVGESTMTVNNTPVQLSVPSEIKDGSVMIELRSLATAFGVDISWNSVYKTVTVN